MGKKAPTKQTKKVSYAHVHKLAAGTALLAFVIILVAGLLAEVSLPALVFRAAVAVMVVGVVTVVLIRVLAAYEEIERS